MSGEVITITQEEETQVKKDLLAGAEWIQVQGNLINTKSIAKVGSHHATAFMEKIEGVQEKTDLKIKADDTKKLDWVEPDHYIDAHTGEKMYS